MKSTGIVRQLDTLGRVVLPVELRKTLNLSYKDSMEIFTDGDTIVLKKYQPSCVFCGNSDNVITYRGKMVCRACRDALANSQE